MAVASLISFLMSLCLFHVTVHCGVIAPVNDTVPFRARCSRMCETPQEESSGKEFPLYQCSCSPSCSVYGDCCFDSKYRDQTVWQNTNFVCLSLIGHGKYRAVYGCPPDQLSDFCIEGLGHMPPVTSRTTNITYANIFCATCNGDREDLVTWNVELSCSAAEPEESPNASNRILYHSGDIWNLNEVDGSKRLCMYRVHFDDFSFLEGLELRPCFEVEKISDCSPSWKHLQTLKMCRSYEDPVYFHNKMYKNSHCAECNYLNPLYADCMSFLVKTVLQRGLIDSTDINRFCQNRGSYACLHILSTMHNGRLYAFSDLLNIEEKGCIPPRGRKCCLGESFDYITKKCRKIVTTE